MGPDHRDGHRGSAIVLGIVLAGVWLYLLYTLHLDWLAAGNSWRQGDWLIHGLAEPVRRGPFGTALLTAADLSGTHPLALLIAFQGVALTLIFGAVVFAVAQLGGTGKLWLLLLSPAFLVVFWFNDPQGAMRKEILVYLAFVPLLAAAVWRGLAGWAVGLAILIYGGAVFSHEGNVFFLPFLWTALWLVMPARLGLAGRIAVLLLPALLALAAGLYALSHPLVADTAPLCAHLVQRGLNPAVCDGAIAYLSTTPEEGRMHPGRLLTTDFRAFLLIYAACLLSVRLLFQSSAWPQTGFLVAVLAGLAFLPLYLLAGDYGRWMNFHISALVLLLLVYFLRDRPDWLFRPLGRLDWTGLMVLYLLVGVSHSPGAFADGFLVQLVRGVRTLLAG
jgi:hypothetical protein